MKFKLLCALLYLGMCQAVNGQLSAVGIQPKLNIARHLNVVQTLPNRLARSAESYLSSPGIDAYADFNMGDKWNLRVKAGVETKGFVSNYYILGLDERAQKYHYITTDLNVMRKWGNNTRIQPYNYLGLTTGYLFKRQVKVLSPVEAKWLDTGAFLTYESYSKLNLGLTVGFGLSFADVLWLELEYNRDVLATINQSNVKVFNTVYSVNVGVNLLKLFQK